MEIPWNPAQLGTRMWRARWDGYTAVYMYIVLVIYGACTRQDTAYMYRTCIVHELRHDLRHGVVVSIHILRPFGFETTD